MILKSLFIRVYYFTVTKKRELVADRVWPSCKTPSGLSGVEAKAYSEVVELVGESSFQLVEKARSTNRHQDPKKKLIRFCVCQYSRESFPSKSCYKILLQEPFMQFVLLYSLSKYTSLAGLS